MGVHAGHTIHREHIHHGCNNNGSRAPEDHARPDRAIPSGRRFVRAAHAHVDGGRLGRVRLARENPVTGPVYIDGAKPGDAPKITVLSFRPSGTL